MSGFCTSDAEDGSISAWLLVQKTCFYNTTRNKEQPYDIYINPSLVGIFSSLRHSWITQIYNENFEILGGPRIHKVLMWPSVKQVGNHQMFHFRAIMTRVNVAFET